MKYLSRRLPSPFNVILSLLFAAIHANLMTFIPLTFFALVLIALYEKTDNLLAPITAHCFFNSVNFSLFIFQSDLERWWKHFV